MGDFKRAKGVIPWKEGDEKPEDVIRRLRDGDPSNLIVQQFAEENNTLFEVCKNLFEIVDDDYGHGIANGYWPEIAPIYKHAKQAIAKCAVCREALDED